MVAVLVLDKALRCDFINAVAEVLTGRSLAQVRRRPVRDVLWATNPEDYAESSLGRTIEAGTGGEGEESIVDNDGMRRPFAFRVVRLGSDNGPEGTLIELVDLGGEAGTGRALRESEQRLRLAVAATGIGIWDVNAVTGQRRWSPEFNAILGLPPDANADTEVFSSLIHPADREWVNALYQRVYTAASPGTYNAEFRIRRANDGAVRWVMTTGRVTFGRDGRALRGIGTLQDIHYRRQSEEALRISEERNRLAIEANDVGTWDYDMLTGEHRWSAQFKKLWGLPPETPADPALLHALVDPKDWAMVLGQWAEARKPSGTGRISLEYRIHRADDGAPRWAMFSGQMFFDEAKKAPVRAIGIMLDITDRREAEERQRLILKELNHRVKNSLAVVQAIVSQTIRMSKPGEAFERIQARLMAVSRTHDFLNQSNWGGVSLMNLLKGELEAFSARDAARTTLRGVAVQLESTTALALGLIFHELATNAAKYGSLSVDEGRLDVSWSVISGAGQPQLAITWAESGGPPVRTPRRTGFGSRLIDGSVKGTLNGSVALDYARSGLQCRIVIPMPPPLETASAAPYPSLAASQRW